MKLTKQSLGEAIRRRRKQLKTKTTQRDLGAAAGISQGSISRIESGEICPSTLDFVSICECLEIEPDDIIFYARNISDEPE